MAEVFFDNPPILNGDEKQQLTQLQRYLGAMSDKLNHALMTITIEQMAPETRQVITEAEEKATQQAQGLKALIVKTAEIVRHEMEEIRVTLQDNYEALSSQFGTLETNLTNELALTAAGVQQNFSYIETIQENEEGYNTFINKYQSHIYVGVIGYNQDTGAPITGISIGEDVTSANGTLNVDKQMATFTAEKLSFFQNGIEVAFFAKNVFYIANGEVTRSMKMGNHTWKVLTGGALALVAGEAPQNGGS